MFAPTKNLILLTCVFALIGCSDDSTPNTTIPTVDTATEGSVTDNNPISGNGNDLIAAEGDITPIQLVVGRPVSEQLSRNETKFFSANSASGVILFSRSGDADIRVLDPSGNEVCSSTSVLAYDLCSDLEIGVDYQIQVSSFIASEFAMVTIDTPPLNGDSTVASAVQENVEGPVYIARGITAVDLLSISGDTNLAILNQDNQLVCSSIRPTGFDSCNNVDGSNRIKLHPVQNYLVGLDGFTNADYELRSFSTNTLLQNTSVEWIVELGSEISYFSENVSLIELTPRTGDADLIVYDTISNEIICSSNASGLTVDRCSVPEGDYRISVIGLETSQFNLAVSSSTSQ